MDRIIDYGSIDIGSTPIEQNKLRICSSMVEQLTFNQFVEGSIPSRFKYLSFIT